MAQVLVALPRYAAFKNQYNSKYLSYRVADKYLCFNGDDVLSQSVKFAIEHTSSGNGQVHIRCFYNNKYFVRNASQFVAAQAAKPDADTSSDTCTLFEPIVIADSGKLIIRFRHVQSGTYACLNYSPTDSAVNDCLCAMSTNPNSSFMDAYEVIDLETMVIFPSHSIVLKGNNGLYLGVTGRNTSLEFRVIDKNNVTAALKIEPVGDGSVYIFSTWFLMYVGYDSSKKILAPYISEKSPNNQDMLFWPYKLGGKVFALRNSATRTFLNVKNGLLCAEENAMTDDTRLAVEENVVSRDIYNIVYRQDDARVHNETPVICGYGEDTNDSDQQDTLQIPIKYTETRTTSWNNMASITVDVSTKVDAEVPFIVDGSIKVDVGGTYEHQWGGKVDETFENRLNYTAAIGKRTHTRISYIATKGKCDVPFSYTESLTFGDGTRTRYIMDDGLFTGVNCYNFSYIKKETPL